MNFICWQSPSGSHGPAYPGARISAVDAPTALAAFATAASIANGNVFCVPESSIVGASVGGVTVLPTLPSYV